MSSKQCPVCKSTKVHKYGTVKTFRSPRKTRYHCYNCGKTFY